MLEIIGYGCVANINFGANHGYMKLNDPFDPIVKI